MTGQGGDARFMAMALSLGRRAQGRCWPNPCVGCVIERDGRVLGRGWTGDGGRPHAETVALAQAGAAARGATAHVTLEPCSHHGRTPPCAEALIAAGVARVVVAARDPDPRVDGAGLARLRNAGIAVVEGVLADAASAAHAGFVSRVVRGRPWLTLKLASSFDGRIATASGESRWITGPLARRAVHAERLRHDAVLVGGGTARADDPRLDVRGLGAARQPVRIVASRRLDLPEAGRLAAGPLWVLHDEAAPMDRRDSWRARGARLLPVVVGADGQLDPSAMLQALGAAGLTRVFCEGGGMLAASLLGAGLVDALVGHTAGLALGVEGRPSLGALGLDGLDQARRFHLLSVRQIGPDVAHVWTRDAQPDGRSLP